MKRCPECKQFFGDEIQHCPNDGTALVERLPGKDPFMGRILAGRYEVLDLIGKGGFGVVFKVRDRKMEDVVALKVFDRRRFTDDEAQEAIKRFRREGVLLRRTGKRSNHIVTVYDFEEDESEDLFYFTMDYVDGTTLGEILAKEGPLDVSRVLDLGRQVCSALKAAHFEGVVHRDLKLENIMVVQEGDQELVKVLDFGIAKVVGSQSFTNLAVGVPGTPGYASPEQLQSPDKIDARTDLFTLGVVLYGLLTGREPWQGSPITVPPSSDKVWDLIRTSLEGKPIPIKKWIPDVPKPLEVAVLKLLEKEQDDRIQSAELLDQELLRIQEILESKRPKEPGSVTVNTGTHGVHVAIRRGFRVVAQGTTPWTARSLRPGEYQVEIRDKRFHKETRKVLVEEAEEAAVHLSATEKPPRRALGELLRTAFHRFRIPLAFAGGIAILIIAGLALRPYLPGPRVPLTLPEFQVAAEAGTIVRTRLQDDRLDGTRWDEEGVEGRFRVNLAGAAIQELAREIRELGIPLETSGSGQIRVTALDEPTGQGAPDISISLQSGGAGCSPCTLGEDQELEGGWYTIQSSGREWTLAGITLRDRNGIFREEDIPVEGASIFIHPGAFLELVSTLTPTETRTTLTSAGEARGRNDVPGSLELVDQVLEGDPAHAWALALKDSLVGDVRAGALAAMTAGDPDAAAPWLGICEALDAEDRDCGRVESWIEARGRAATAFQRGQMASAQELAGECLRASPADGDCANIDREATQALAAQNVPEPEPEQPPEAPPTTPPQTRPQTTLPPAEAETPGPPRQSPGLVRALSEARDAMDRDELGVALVSVRRALEIAPDDDEARNLRGSILTQTKNRAMGAFRAADAQGVQSWIRLCLDIDPTDAECVRAGEWLQAKGQARTAFESGNPEDALRLAQLCLQRNQNDQDCARLAERAREALAAQEEEPPPAPPAPALGASDLAIQLFRFSDGAFSLEANFSAVGPGEAPMCVASVFGDASEGSLQDTDGQFSLGGLVAVIGPSLSPGPDPQSVSVSHTLPVNQLDRRRGQVRVVATTKVWAGTCGSVDPRARPLVEIASEEICVFRFPGGWYLCRE